MKNIFLVLLTLVLLSSCGEFQKTYNGKDVAAKYKLAWKLYEKGKYSKADQLFSQIDRAYKDKPAYQRLLFADAMSLFKMKFYTSAGEKFRKFTQLFPESSKAEEASYYIVLAYDRLSPKSSVDQAYTKRAIEEVAGFIKKYPFSKYKKEVNAINKKLNYKLEKKDYTIAKQYYDLSRYKAAITAFNNYLIDFPGSSFTEETLYYRYEAASELAINSVLSKKEDRIKQAMGFYQNFIKKYPQTKFLKEAKKTYDKLQKELQNMQTAKLATK